MSDLSISVAWDETKAIIARDGRLFASLALALVALPVAVMAIVNPRGMTDSSTPLWVDIVGLIATLVVLAGQLALIRMALGPSITVGAAIAHGLRRMPIYVLSALIMVAALFLAAIPFALVLVAAGVRAETEAELLRAPAFWFVAALYLLLLCYVGVRMLMTSSVATAEPVGPVAIIKRSWHLTSGHFWSLFLFLVMFFIAAIIVVVAVGAAVGVAVQVAFGPIEPMSVSALVVALVQALVQAAVTTVLAVMLARIYLQLAGRAEPEVSVPTTGI